MKLLAWLGRWRGATSPQLARALGIPLKVAERRMRALTALGLVAGRAYLHGIPRVHWLTRAGMTAVGLDGSVASPVLAELQHDLAVVELAHYIGQLQPDAHVVTEREIRRDEPNPAATDGLSLRTRLEIGVGLGTGGRKFPDLGTIHAGGDGETVWAHEYERTRKEGPRLTDLMWYYSRADHIAGVVYWVAPELHANTERAAKAANERAETPKVVVRAWTP
jgi:hypothetical protein